MKWRDALSAGRRNGYAYCGLGATCRGRGTFAAADPPFGLSTRIGKPLIMGFSSSASIRYFMQIRRLGAAIGNAEGLIAPCSTEWKWQPEAGLVIGVIARRQKRLP